MVERKLTGAHYGLRDWAMQRATAVIMLIYTVALLVILFTLPKEYSAWQAFFDQVWVKVFTQVSFIAVFLHAWVGGYPRFVDGLYQTLRRAFVFAGCHHRLVGRLLGVFN